MVNPLINGHILLIFISSSIKSLLEISAVTKAVATFCDKAERNCKVFVKNESFGIVSMYALKDGIQIINLIDFLTIIV